MGSHKVFFASRHFSLDSASAMPHTCVMVAKQVQRRRKTVMVRNMDAGVWAAMKARAAQGGQTMAQYIEWCHLAAQIGGVA